MNLQEHIRRILREDKELNPNKRVYDYDKERDTVPERLPFDIDKLVNSGVVFVTPAIDGDPDSKTYKKWLEEPYTHLLTLHNVKHSSEDGWIKKAITKVAPTKAYKGNFFDKIYDGKYNQILWGLKKLGINPMDMLIDMNIQENISRIRSMMEINESWEHNVKVRIKDMLPINSDGQSLQDAIANVKDGLISHSEDNVLLYKVGKKYEIGDGFHRIAQKILNGEKYIIADIKTSEE